MARPGSGRHWGFFYESPEQVKHVMTFRRWRRVEDGWVTCIPATNPDYFQPDRYGYRCGRLYQRSNRTTAPPTEEELLTAPPPIAGEVIAPLIEMILFQASEEVT